MRLKHLPPPRLLLLCLLYVWFPSYTLAQTIAPRSRITQRPDETRLTTLRGNTHPLAQPQFNRGAAPSSLLMNRMLLVLRPSPEQEAALTVLLDGQQDKSSPNFHKWLTPEQFGQQFGVSDQDLQTVTGWLGSHGFQVNRVTRGRTIVEFSGTAGQVQEAFHTEIRKFLVDGEERWANSSDPQIPAALAPVIVGVNSLHDFPKTPNHFSGGVFSRSQATGEVQGIQPDFTFPNSSRCRVNGSCYFMGPYDFATIYNALPLWNANPAIDGTGQSIAIVGGSNINLQDVRDFRNMFGLPPNDPVVIVDGPDPGIVPGYESEADLDVEWAGAVAKGATIKYVPSASTNTTSGIDLSALYIIENNLAPIMSESFGVCELFLGTAGNSFENAIREQAAAQGITFINSSGDEGSARCDAVHTNTPATHGLMVSGLASSPFGVAVGGTDFVNFGPNFSAGIPSPYWNSSNNAQHASARGYIPESTWNSTCTNNVFVILGYGTTPEASCNNANSSPWRSTLAGGGGKSSCTVSDGTTAASCSGGYAKPSWQIGPGVPNDGKRDIPDVSLFASPGFMDSYYIVCESDLITSGSSCNLNAPYTNFIGFGGTSASAPSFAGIMALVNQYTQSSGQGNANYVLYKLAALPSQTSLNCNSGTGPASGCIFNDVTSGTIATVCAKNSPDCNVTNQANSYGVLSGYDAGIGYDRATGLGTVNAFNLVHNWNLATFATSNTNLTLNNGSPVNISHGQMVPVTVSVTGGTGTPSGDVSLLATSINGQGVDGRTLSNGSASWSTNQLPGGNYSVKAHYAGDGVYGASDSAPVTVSVSKEDSATAVSILSAGSSGNFTPFSNGPYGSTIYLRSDVGAQAANNTIATGCVNFWDNGVQVAGNPPPCSYALNSDGTSFAVYGMTTSTLVAPGTHSISASYGGDNSFNPSSSAPVTFTITPAATQVTLNLPQTIITSTNLAYIRAEIVTPVAAAFDSHGQVVGGALPTGTVSIFMGNTQIGTSLPVGGNIINHKTFAEAGLQNVQLPVTSGQQYSLTAVYNGDANYASSTSAVVTLQVLYPSTMSLSRTGDPDPLFGAGLTFTAQISPSQAGSPAVTGTVQFLLDNLKVTTSPIAISNGIATYTTGALSPGVHQFEADYSGDGNYLMATSVKDWSVLDFTFTTPQTTVNISAPGMSSSPVPLTLNVPPEYTGTTIFSFTPASCVISPAGSLSSCSFNPGNINTSGTTQVTINTTAPNATSKIPISFPPQIIRRVVTLGALLAMLIVTLKFRDRRLRFALRIFVFAAIMCTTGCGGTGGGSAGGGTAATGTPRGTYTVNVLATNGQASHSTSFKFTVQ